MKLTSFVLSLLFLPSLLPLLAAQDRGGNQPPPPPPPPRQEKQFGPGHPLLAVLDSDDFTSEERTRLRKLSYEDPQKFAQEMRRHFQKRRQEKAKNMLALRQAYMDAKTPELKDAARKKIQDTIRQDTERHLLFQKKVLSDTENAIRQMEKRLADMKKRYDRQLAEKDAVIEKRTQELLAPNPPHRLVRDAAGDFQRRPRKKK